MKQYLLVLLTSLAVGAEAVSLDEVLDNQQQGNHVLAISQLQELMAIEPEQIRYHLDLAKSLYAVKQYELAARHVKYALSKKLPDNVRKNAESFYQVIIAKHKATSDEPIEEPLSVALLISMGYDSNVNSFPYDSSLLWTIDGSAEKESALYHDVGAYLSYRYNYKDWVLQPNISVLAQSYPYGELDKERLAMSFGNKFLYDYQSVHLSLPISYQYQRLNGSDGDHALSFSPNVRFWDNWDVGMSISRQNSDDNTRWVMNAHTGYTWIWQGYRPYVQYQASNVVNAEAYMDYLASEFSLGSRYRQGKLQLQGEISAQSKVFQDELPREDFIWQVMTKVSYRLPYRATLSGEWQSDLNRSNVALYEYNRQRFELSIGMNF